MTDESLRALEADLTTTIKAVTHVSIRPLTPGSSVYVMTVDSRRSDGALGSTRHAFTTPAATPAPQFAAMALYIVAKSVEGMAA